MIGLIQRVTRAAVRIDGETVGAIDRGLAVLVGIAPEDDEADSARLLERLLAYRLFPDADGRMNLSLVDIAGGLLLVPNFTLMADTRKGLRPSFTPAAPPQHAAPLFADMVARARERHAPFAAGRFGADMQVELVNDGPVTVRLDTR